MKRKIVLSTYELKCIEEYVEWCFKNPAPCSGCGYESDTESCTGCEKYDKWKNVSDKVYNRIPQEYQETFKFLNQIGYIDKLLEKIKIDKEIRELRTKQSILCCDISSIERREGIEISNAGH